jgi:hypothetical protein
VGDTAGKASPDAPAGAGQGPDTAQATPIGAWTARRVLGLWACGLALATAALHVPGQVSYDSSIQLLEAASGASRSWHPPFMSALLQAMGGGPRATTAFVLLCTAMTYAGLALAVPAVSAREHRGKIVVATMVIANPVLLLYSGIVWKDVLLAAFLCLACGASIATAGASSSRRRWLLAGIAAACLVAAAHSRQQGLIFLPLAILPLLAAREGRTAVALPLGAWSAGVLLAFLLAGHWAGARISHVQGWDRERGVQRILAFDILGTLAVSRHPATVDIAGGIGGIEAVRRAYDPARIDAIRQEAAVAGHFDDVDTGRLWGLWHSAVAADPAAYVRHRSAVAAHVLGIADLHRCLPVHVGIAGPVDALSAVGMSPRVGSRARWLHAKAQPLFATPLFRHWFTLAMTLCIVGLSFRIRHDPAGTSAFWFACAATTYAMATTAFAIACDFRYLYPVLAVSSACAIAVLFRARLPWSCRHRRPGGRPGQLADPPGDAGSATG